MAENASEWHYDNNRDSLWNGLKRTNWDNTARFDSYRLMKWLILPRYHYELLWIGNCVIVMSEKNIWKNSCKMSKLHPKFLAIFWKSRKPFTVTQCCIDANSVVQEIAKNYLTSLDWTQVVNFQEFRKTDTFIVMSVENYPNVIKIVSQKPFLPG